MYQAIVTLRGASPLSWSKFNDTPKLNKETPEAFEKRTWREKVWADEQGQVCIPPMALKNSLAEGAKRANKSIPGKGKSTYTKYFESGVIVQDMRGMVLDGINKDDLECEWLPVPSNGERGGGKRVLKCFPLIKEWEGTATYTILDEAITREVFEEILRETGSFVGLGRWRPKNNGLYGRFEVVKVVYKEVK